MYSVLGRIATIAHLNDIIENGGSSSPYSPESYSGPDREEMTFWDKRKVLGGNSSLAGTPDGLAGPAIAVADFFTEDFGTLISQDATAGERGLALALLIPIVKPLRLLKPLDDVVSGGKTVGKGTDNPLLPGEGKVGTYEELIDAGTREDNITPHPMPSAKYMKTNAEVHKNDGVSMNMEQPHPGKGGETPSN